MPATILFPCPDRRSCHATFRFPARPLRRPACRCLYRPFHSIRPGARCGQQTPIKGSPRFFTGTVRIDPLYAANNAMRSSGGSVTFEPGSRSHWHIHPVGQVLVVTAGVGLTQEWGKPIQEIRAGDVVICPAKIKHWHGAAPGSAMTHISICEETEPGKVVEWLEPVTDSQYAGR